MSFKDHVAIVTGGNSGIGKAIAKAFSEAGAKVAIIGRNSKTLKETEGEFTCKSYQADVSDLTQLETALLKIHQDFGSFDHLILNAGVLTRLETLEMTESDFDQVMNTNVKGPYFTFQKSIPYLKENASVVAISSIAAQLPIANHGVYAASKAALNRITAAFSAEFLPTKGIRINTISPGYTETPIFKERVKADPQFIEKASKCVPIKRMAKPSEIAKCALYLCSDDALAISGANIVVDGGFCSRYPLKEMQSYYSDH